MTSEVDLPDFDETIYLDYPDWRRCSTCDSRGTVEVKLATSSGGFVIGYDTCQMCEGNGGWVVNE